MRSPFALLIIAIACLATWEVFGGSLEPPGPPAPTMVTLEEIHAAVGAAAGARYELVGTTTPIAADSGYLGLTRKCQDEFGAQARLCTTREVMTTVNLPAAADYHSSQGWVQGVPVGVSSHSNALNGDDQVFTLDATGSFFGFVIPTCSRWSATGGSGLTMKAVIGDSEGTIQTTNCNSTSVGAACCAPAP